ncbi:MAG: uracil-DNA glycosylase family protein, partial [bacterium]
MKPWRKFGPGVYGDASTGYLLVGEAPGYVSWRKGWRFTGQAGMLIRRALRSVGHPRYWDLEDLFYMTDVVKCHPAAPASPSSNRSPRRVEVEACSSYLLRELQVLRPSAIVTFGKAAAESVTRAIKHATGPVEASSVTRQAGDRSSASRCMLQTEVIPFPHPSPRNQVTILKQYPSMRAFEDAIARTFRRLIA